MQPGASDDIHTHVARKRLAWMTRLGWRAPRAPRPRRSLVLGGLVLAAVVSTRWVRLNVSPSVPLGAYRLAAVRETLLRDTLVVLPVPASVRSFWPSWMPLLKPIAGLPGDQVCVLEGTLWIRDLAYGPVLTASHGHPVPHVEGCLVVQAGEVFLASQAPHSLDSRYFGPIPVAALTAQATPLVTWR
jgi:type IV secretory pathway protease TraF